MPTQSRPSRSGVAWLILIFLPFLVILAGLVAAFIWQGSKGAITPKWRKPAPAITNSTTIPPVPDSP